MAARILSSFIICLIYCICFFFFNVEVKDTVDVLITKNAQKSIYKITICIFECSE
jgi:hypothetical protein